MSSFVAPSEVARDAPAPERRGPLRPENLASSRARIEARSFERLVQAIEAAVVLVPAFVLCGAAHPQGLLLAPLAGVLPFAAGAPLLLACLAGRRAGSMQHRETLRRSLARLCGGLLLAALPIALIAAALPLTQAERAATELWFALSAAAIALLHPLWWRRIVQLRREGKFTPTIVVVGATPNAERLIAQARQTREVAVLGIFDDRADRAPRTIGGVPVLGDTGALLAHGIMPAVDRVVITVPSGAQKRVRELIERLRPLPNELALLVDVHGEIEPCSALSSLARAPVARVSGPLMSEARALAKRAQDLAIGAAALVVAAPVMLAVALAVKLDTPGPVFFRQRRHGFNNEAIEVWKFRSMRHAAADATAARQVTANDARVTRVGRFIRRTSLDELPQLFNVLRGEMSLVGPRPHAIGMRTGDVESARLVAEYAHRHRMKPGITSWAAIHGSRGPVHTAEAVRRRVALDVAYIERQSFWLDLYILAMTLPCLLGDREALR